jgi:hypothetical protein
MPKGRSLEALDLYSDKIVIAGRLAALSALPPPPEPLPFSPPRCPPAAVLAVADPDRLYRFSDEAIVGRVIDLPVGCRHPYTVFRLGDWADCLSAHPDKLKVSFVLDGLARGFNLRVVKNRVLPMVSANGAAALAQPDVTLALIQEDVKRGALVELPAKPDFAVVSPVDIVPKRNGAFRLIHNLSFGRQSSVNKRCSPMPCHYLDWQQLFADIVGKCQVSADGVWSAPSDVYAVAFDVKAAYRNMPIRQSDVHLLLLEFLGRYFASLAAAFGHRNSPGLWVLVAELINWMIQRLALGQHARLFNYSDNFIFIVRGLERALLLKTACLSACARLGIPLSDIAGPTQLLRFCGIMLDLRSMSARCDPDKVALIIDLIQQYSAAKQCTAKELASLVGRLLFVTRLAISARPVLSRIHAVSIAAQRCEQAVVLFRQQQLEDLTFFLSLLTQWDGSRFIFLADWAHDMPVVDVYTDASEWGFGAVCAQTGAWIRGPWPPAVMAAAQRAIRYSTGFLELVAAAIALTTFQQQLRQRLVVLHTDNTSVVALVDKLSAPSAPALVVDLLRDIALLSVTSDCRVRPIHVRSADNFADALSREQDSTWSPQRPCLGSAGTARFPPALLAMQS